MAVFSYLFTSACLARAFWRWSGRLGIADVPAARSRRRSRGSRRHRIDGSTIRHIDKPIGMIARNEMDLVAVRRALLVDPEWATKMRDNRMQNLPPFTPESLRSLS
jgi:2,4-dienoyl-CoA reductase-like NADH-dependent reductase (Old Yellow Enzyme family)